MEENIHMLKKIHNAKPTVRNSDLLKHEAKTKQLKKMVSDGAKRQSILDAAREMIITKERAAFKNKAKLNSLWHVSEKKASNSKRYQSGQGQGE